MNIKAINERSIFLANTSKSNDKAIADHCILIAEHIKEHGDVTAATVLCDAFGKTSGLRVNAIRQWFLSYGGCSWNADSKKFGKRKTGTFSFNREEAVKNPWYTLRPEPEFKAVDLDKMLANIIKKANAALEDVDHIGEHKVDKGLLNALIKLTEKEPHYVAKATNEVKSEGVDVGLSATSVAPEKVSVH